MLEAIGSLGALPTGGDAALVQATSVARQAARLREQLLPFTPKDDAPGYTSPVAYPTGEDDRFPRRLAGLAAMLAAGLPVRVVALSAPGMYDTHDDQPTELASGLKLTAESLLAFQRDLESRVGKVRPGGLGELEARFLPGRFTLWCSLADHRKRGMSATLVVRRP